MKKKGVLNTIDYKNCHFSIHIGWGACRMKYEGIRTKELSQYHSVLLYMYTQQGPCGEGSVALPLQSSNAHTKCVLWETCTGEHHHAPSYKSYYTRWTTAQRTCHIMACVTFQFGVWVSPIRKHIVTPRASKGSMGAYRVIKPMLSWTRSSEI